ncbi:MAG: triacylglycerol lipase [Polyangiales bacterium]
MSIATLMTLIALAVLFAAGLFAWRGRRGIGYRVRRFLGRDQPRYPIVLVHGLLGFAKVARVEYFRGVRASLKRRGIEVISVTLPPVGSIEDRARSLAEQLSSVEGKVNVVAHSMGGLDARYAIAHLGLHVKVASLVTIGTPHHGTPVANFGASAVQHLGLRGAARLLGVDVAALEDLRPKGLSLFNESTPDAQGVFYGSIVGEAKEVAHPLLKASKLLLPRLASDGLVPTESQRWGMVLREVEADHWAQIGWSSSFDAIALYEELSCELSWRGF